MSTFSLVENEIETKVFMIITTELLFAQKPSRLRKPGRFKRERKSVVIISIRDYLS